MQLYDKLLAATDRFLDVGLGYLGAIPFDEQLRRAVQQQKAVVQAYPRSKAAKSFIDIASKIDQWRQPEQASGYLQFFVERLLAARTGSG